MEADRLEREAQLAKLEADLFNTSILPAKDGLAQTRWSLMVQPPGRRVGKTTLLRQLAARYVAAGRKVYVLTTCTRTWQASGFQDVGATNLVDTWNNEELFDGDRSNRVYLVDEAQHVSLPLLNVIKEDVRSHPGCIYIETHVKDVNDDGDDFVAFPRVIVPMPQSDKTWGDYFPNLGAATTDEKRAFFHQLSTQAN